MSAPGRWMPTASHLRTSAARRRTSTSTHSSLRAGWFRPPSSSVCAGCFASPATTTGSAICASKTPDLCVVVPPLCGSSTAFPSAPPFLCDATAQNSPALRGHQTLPCPATVFLPSIPCHHQPTPCSGALLPHSQLPWWTESQRMNRLVGHPPLTTLHFTRENVCGCRTF